MAFPSQEKNRIFGNSQIGLSLGAWVANQRGAKRGGYLSIKRSKLLSNLPGWAWDRNDAAFQTTINALCSFYKREGHYRVPHGHVEDGINLGRSIRNLRRDYRFNRHRLSSADIAKVEDLQNWTWTPLDDAWNMSVAVLKQFVLDNGHISPSKNLRFNGINLANFIHATRRSYRKGTLSPQKQSDIESVLGWDWDGSIEVSLDVHIAAINRYEDLFGNIDIPYNYRTESGLKLGSWIFSQKTRKRNNQLSIPYITKLERIQGWTWD